MTKGHQYRLGFTLAQTQVSYFSFKWLDTASISLLMFGEEFTNYEVDKMVIKQDIDPERGTEMWVQWL